MRLQFSAVARKSTDPDRAAQAADFARVGHWLQPETFLLDAAARDVEHVLHIAADTIGDAHGISPAMLFDALQRREQAASTALGAGFAIPHARLSGIDRPVTVFMRLRSAIPFGAADDIPVTCVLVIIVPKNGADADHLTMLGLISALFSAGDFRKRIAAASDVVTAEAAFRTCISTLVQKSHVD